MTTHRTGSPFSYQRFASAKHICVDCQRFGLRQYGATFVATEKFGRDEFSWIPACDVCGLSLMYIEAVTVALRPFEETPDQKAPFGIVDAAPDAPDDCGADCGVRSPCRMPNVTQRRVI